MDPFNQPPRFECSVLATDLDGTLIPLPNHPEHKEALDTLRAARKEHPFTFIYATGRHYESVRDVMDEKRLPTPDWIICDVGTSIYHRSNDGFVPFDPYALHLDELTEHTRRGEIENLLTDIDGLASQPPEHQQTFKISYECEQGCLEQLSSAIANKLQSLHVPFHVISSVDPFNKRGLIDVLPDGVSKAYALIWLSTHADFTPDQVIFSGDSGNDLAALTCGFKAVVVGNASDDLAKQVDEALRRDGNENLFYRARGTATSGVLEGCRHFGLVPTE